MSPFAQKPLREPEKRIALGAALDRRDLGTLIDLAATPGGFIDDEIRRRAWPMLLGRKDEEPNDYTWQALPRHRDEAQVTLDCDRSFVYYPKGLPSELDRLRADLQGLIVQTLRRCPELCYFQGYHDIVQVLLLVLGREQAPDCVLRLSLLRIRDFMLSSLSASIVHLRMLPYIIKKADPVLEKHLGQTQPFYALASALTLYAHDIEDYHDIARLFDFFLTSDASMTIYFFAMACCTVPEEGSPRNTAGRAGHAALAVVKAAETYGGGHAGFRVGDVVQPNPTVSTALDHPAANFSSQCIVHDVKLDVFAKANSTRWSRPLQEAEPGARHSKENSIITLDGVAATEACKSRWRRAPGRPTVMVAAARTTGDVPDIVMAASESCAVIVHLIFLRSEQSELYLGA
ncbi:hypothetical protein MRB53_041646 [Persea americana]|nr:hypothetical protein MRB53_041646 [Persea americana]